MKKKMILGVMLGLMICIGTTCLFASGKANDARDKSARIVLEGETKAEGRGYAGGVLKFLNAKGKIIKKMKLRNNSRIAPAQEIYPEAEEGYKVAVVDEEKAYVSPIGKHAAIVSLCYIDEEGAEDEKTSIKILSCEGKMILEKADVTHSAKFLGKGEKLLFAVKDPKRPHFLSPDAIIWIYDVVQGEPVVMSGPYENFGSVEVSPNGQYFVINPKLKDGKRKVLMYNLSTGKTSEKEGWYHRIKVHDDGFVELYINDGYNLNLAERSQMP